MTTISIARDFSQAPVGVYRNDSNYSAEKFREDILIPAIRRDNVKIDLSGTCGYGASWLQGVFGTLYTCNQFHETYLDNHLEVYASDPKDNCYLDAVKRYIEEAKKANATRNKKVTLDEQLAKLVKAMNLVNQAYWWFLNNDYNELAVETSMRIERDIGQLISDINDIQKLKEEQQ